MSKNQIEAIDRKLTIVSATISIVSVATAAVATTAAAIAAASAVTHVAIGLEIGPARVNLLGAAALIARGPEAAAVVTAPSVIISSENKVKIENNDFLDTRDLIYDSFSYLED